MKVLRSATWVICNIHPSVNFVQTSWCLPDPITACILIILGQLTSINLARKNVSLAAGFPFLPGWCKFFNSKLQGADAENQCNATARAKIVPKAFVQHALPHQFGCRKNTRKHTNWTIEISKNSWKNDIVLCRNPLGWCWRMELLGD